VLPTRTCPPVLAALLLGACAHPPRASSPDAEQLIRRRLALWVEQFNAGDYRGAATIWAPDLVGWMAEIGRAHV
jgi:hypothetical protein